MSQVSTRPPSGMRDFLPEDVARRRHVVSVVRTVYERHGFQPLETPSIENLAVLLGKYGEEGDQLLYRLLHRRDALRRALEAATAAGRSPREDELADLGLRYDLTVPLARVVAQYDLPRFFKRYQIQPVWRADRPGKGRFREFWQCDVDVTGTASATAEAEVCGAVTGVLERLGFTDFTLRVNHRELLRAIIRAAGIAPRLEGTALVALDKLDKVGGDGVARELVERGITPAQGERLLEITQAGADLPNAAVLAAVAAEVDDAGQAAIGRLGELLELLAANAAGPRTRVDPALARGLAYYTGPIFEITVTDLAGSLGGGGRYDELVGTFTRRSVPAVGFSLGLERIVVLMEERGLYPELRLGPDVLLCWTGVPPARVLEVANRLRDAAVKVEVYPEAAKLGRQLQYAAASGVDARFAGILGEAELLAGELTLKDLARGTQARVAVGAVAAAIRAT